MSLLASRYAKALFDAAAARDAVEAVAQDLAVVKQELEDPTVRAMVLDPDTPAETRHRVLLTLGQGRDELTRNLLSVLESRRRCDVLPNLQIAFRRLVMQQRGEVDGLLETAHPPDEDSLRAIQATANKLTGKQVVLTVRENPELIGGVRLRVGNTLYDGSLLSAIEDLERRLMTARI